MSQQGPRANISSGGALLRAVQLQHRDDFDTQTLPQRFHNVIQTAPESQSHLDRLYGVVTEYYPWMPTRVLTDVATVVKDSEMYAEAEDEELPYEITWDYCCTLRDVYDDWVGESTLHAQEMYTAEMDMEELYMVAERINRTSSDLCHADLEAAKERATRAFFPESRVETVVRQACATEKMEVTQ